MNALQSVQLVPVRRIRAEIGQFIRIRIQIEQQRPHFFDVYVFPPPVEYHCEPSVVLIDADGAAGVSSRVVVLGNAERPPFDLLSLQQWMQRPAFHDVRLAFAAEELDECGNEIDALDQSVRGVASRSVRFRARVVDDQRDASRAIVEQILLAQPMVAHIVSMIGAENDHRVVHAAQFGQPREQAAHLIVKLLDQAHVYRRYDIPDVVARKRLASPNVHPRLHQRMIGLALRVAAVDKRQVSGGIHVVVGGRGEIRPVGLDVAQVAKPRLVALSFNEVHASRGQPRGLRVLFRDARGKRRVFEQPS